jgi:hypothetical protein
MYSFGILHTSTSENYTSVSGLGHPKIKARALGLASFRGDALQSFGPKIEREAYVSTLLRE